MEPGGARTVRIVVQLPIVQLEHEHGIPRNPFVNAGAIVVTDIVFPAISRVRRSASFCVLSVISPMTIRSASTIRWRNRSRRRGFRNFALANFMRSFGNLHHPVNIRVGRLFPSVRTIHDLRAVVPAGRFWPIAAVTRSPGTRSFSDVRARRINALMLTCGHYDGSGDFAYHVGLPGKAAFGGGIMAVAPGKASIAVWSPASTRSAIRRSGHRRWNCWRRKPAGPYSGLDLTGVWGHCLHENGSRAGASG